MHEMCATLMVVYCVGVISRFLYLISHEERLSDATVSSIIWPITASIYMCKQGWKEISRVWKD